MIQKEVAQKMNYINKMNRLNILTTITSDFKIEFDVSKNVFFPKPKVLSSVIKITPKKKINYNFIKLQNFTRILFRYKRKKLRNVLPEEELKKLKFKKSSYKINDILESRAEDLTIEKIIFLFKSFLQS
jgi:16S rRNA (adenine1518-N6/adenine1519-N6)-dimethyltransferase